MQGWKSLIALSVLAVSVALDARAAEHTFVIKRLTNDDLSDANPQVSGKNVVWWTQTGAASASREISFYDGETVVLLTNNAYLDQDPQISGNRVAWWGQPDGTAANQREIFYFDGATTTRLTNDNVRDYPPVISGSLVVWPHGDGAAKEIYQSNGPPTSDALYDGLPDVFGARIAWVNNTTPHQKVLLYNGLTTTQVHASGLAMNDPQVSDSLVVWQGFKNTNINASGAEIYRYDGTNPNNPTNISNNEFPDFDPQVSGQNTVWWGGVFNDFQIYFNDGLTTTEISTGIRNQFPQIDGNFVVWQGYDGVDDEIYFWDGATVTQLSSNNESDAAPQISGNHVVWQATIGGKSEIMSALRVLFGDANFDGLVDGADYTLWADHFLEQDLGFAQGDFNQDGVIDGADYTLWADNFLADDNAAPAADAVTTAHAVPEPASFALSTIAGIAGLAVCRRRRVAAQKLRQ